MTDAVFIPEGDLFRPTDLARGPWDPRAQHGGPPASLLARAVERADGGESFFVARLTIDLLRPVPLTPLRIETRMTRPGRRVQSLEAVMTANGVDVARAHGLRILRCTVVLPDEVLDLSPPPPGPEQGRPTMPPARPETGVHGFAWDAMELRSVGGGFESLGPATVWLRLRYPMVAGEETSPLMKVAAAADFGNGISKVFEFGTHLFINPDLTIVLDRYPEGDWVCLDARTSVRPNGVGLAESALFDEIGRIGRSIQTLVVDTIQG